MKEGLERVRTAMVAVDDLLAWAVDRRDEVAETHAAQAKVHLLKLQVHYLRRNGREAG